MLSRPGRTAADSELSVAGAPRGHTRQHTACAAAAAAGVTLQCVGCFLEKRCALSGMRRARDVGAPGLCPLIPAGTPTCIPPGASRLRHNFQPHQAANDTQQQLKNTTTQDTFTHTLHTDLLCMAAPETPFPATCARLCPSCQHESLPSRAVAP